ncbi:MAG TPA: hypothetical protein VND65_05890 [Candidatus Binatia bacterium]|nr:hypothetical protein [Candidatus Binatia bacterium]
MKKTLLVVLVACLAACAFAQEAQDRHVYIMRPATHVPDQNPPSFTIDYHGGPILNVGTSVYLIYYGNWPTLSQQIVDYLVLHLGGTPLHNIQTTYYDSKGVNIPNTIKFNPKTNVYHDNYSLGKNLTDANVQTIVSNAIAGGHLANDVNGVYFVLTAKDVNESDFGGSLCTLFCGYHSPSTSIVTGETINYSIVGNPARCPSACDGNVAIYGDKTGPNGDIGGDGTVSILFHELSESESDPQYAISYGWGPPNTSEEGDDCNFVFGTTKIAANGAHYNQTIAGRNFLIQEMLELVNPSGDNNTGNCVQGK